MLFFKKNQILATDTRTYVREEKFRHALQIQTLHITFYATSVFMKQNGCTKKGRKKSVS